MYAPVRPSSMQLGSPSRPASSLQAVSRSHSVFLCPFSRLAWSGPWKQPPGHGPTKSQMTRESMLMPSHGSMPDVVVKMPVWGQTILKPQRPMEVPSLAATLDDSNNAGGAQSSTSSRQVEDTDRHLASRGSSHGAHGHGRMQSKAHGAFGSSGSKAVPSRSRSGPLLTCKSSLAFGLRNGSVDSIAAYVDEIKRDKHHLKDFLQSRWDNDLDGDTEAGLNDLCLFHSLAARKQTDKVAKRKKPPLGHNLAASQSGDVGDKAAANAGATRLNSRRASGSASVMEVHQLCQSLKKQTKSTDVTKRTVEAKFADAIRRNEEAGVSVEIVANFGALISFLHDTCGSLENAMQCMDPKKKQKLNKQMFEKGVESLGHKESSAILAKIFAVLDEDHDSEITYADVTKYQPRTDIQGRLAPPPPAHVDTGEAMRNTVAGFKGSFGGMFGSAS